MKDRSFTTTRILLALTDKPSHGWEIAQGLSGDRSIEMSSLYRTLRSMEQNGAIASSWEDSDQGPRRRVYEITNAGHDLLRDLVREIIAERNKMNAVLAKASEIKRKEEASRVSESA